ncbi:hypothetical protein INN71_13455 [Nocardioides sp. ChNu-153]|uniref:hypothetical protein n=1 Tax=unclassified Nocardioides TaxID=2615069 RepID=UPI002404A0DC|nr:MULTISPECIES: hypothetical protein [unclassified Nocardioides]MDF9717352.1 hypothetical protein [Nocardioides sp. ChNu-99]MDN7122393.1 hypothetical protein [Nocardioides sp. ChNu-153]
MATTRVSREVIDLTLKSIDKQIELIAQYQSTFVDTVTVDPDLYGEWQPGYAVRAEHSGAQRTLSEHLASHHEVLVGVRDVLSQVAADVEATDEMAATAMVAAVHRISGGPNRPMVV